MIINGVMNKPIVVDKDVMLEEAARILTDKNISSILYVKGKSPIGIITKGDICKNFGNNTPISKIMSKKLLYVTPDDKVTTAIEMMNDNKISVLPVIKEKELVGVVSAKDLLYGACKLDDFLFG